MFKDLLKDMSSSVVGTMKNTAKAYSPFAGVGQGTAFERIAHQGISNLAYRSPLMADIAASMLENFQAEHAQRTKMKDFIKSDASKEMREQFRGKLGADVSDKTLDKEMLSVLRKLVGAIDENGLSHTQKTEEYKEYGKYIEKIFGKDEAVTKDITTDQTGIGTGIVTEQLDKIEVNTHRTVNTLEEMAMKHDLAGGQAGVSGAGGSGSGTPASYVDPLTGLPSVNIAAGAIGGKLLARVFDDDAIEKLASKAKKFFGLSDEEVSVVTNAPITPAPEAPRASRITPADKHKETINKSIKDILGDLNLDLDATTPADKHKETINKPIKDILGDLNLDLDATTPPTVEERREENAAEAKRDHESTTVAKETLSEIKKLSDKGLGKSDEKSGGSIFDVFKSKAIGSVLSKIPGVGGLLGGLLGGGGAIAATGKLGGSVLGGALSTAGKMAGYIPGALSTVGTAASGAMGTLGTAATGAIGKLGALGTAATPALAVAGAGAAGYAAGKYLLNPLIDKGISALTGQKDMSLGSYIYDLLNSDESSKMSAAPKPSPNVDVAKKTLAAELSTATAKKEELEAKKSVQQTQPIVLNNNTSGSTPSAPAPIIAPVSIRNQDSTFERVQMQNYWSRSF